MRDNRGERNSKFLNLESARLCKKCSALALFLFLARMCPDYFSKGARTMAERTTGTVKWYDEAKGFGFISRDGGKDLFVHATALENTGNSLPMLNEVDTVEFDVEENAKGPKATNVVRVH